MQNAAGIAQPARTGTTQGVCIDPRDLRGDIGAKAHLPTGKRIGNLERSQVEVLPGAGEQRFEKLHVRRDYQFIAPAVEQIQHTAACRFDTCRLWREHLFDAIWQKPAVYRCHIANHLSIRQAYSNEPRS